MLLSFHKVLDGQARVGGDKERRVAKELEIVSSGRIGLPVLADCAKVGEAGQHYILTG